MGLNDTSEAGPIAPSQHPQEEDTLEWTGMPVLRSRRSTGIVKDCEAQ
jgi:hypothetical protein